MNIFVISLVEAIDRRSFISSQLKVLDLEFEFVDGIRGRDLYEDPTYYDRRKALRIELRDMTPGEVGCALSHQKVYDKIVERDLPYALVLEDDAVLSPDLPEVLSRLEKRIKPNDLIQLERCDVYSRKGREPLYKRYSLVKPTMIRYGSISQAAGYVVTREAARKIRTINRPVYVPADSWGQYRGMINFRSVVPTLSLVRQNVAFECTTQDYQRSEFTPSTRLGLLIYAFKTRSTLGRFLVRSAKRVLRREAR
jgi:glycosyl transferase, family 25